MILMRMCLWSVDEKERSVHTSGRMHAFPVCVFCEKEDKEKLRDIEFTVVDSYDAPEELQEKIDDKKERHLRSAMRITVICI